MCQSRYVKMARLLGSLSEHKNDYPNEAILEGFDT